MANDEESFELLMDKLQEYFDMQEELQNLLRCGYMRILQARYSLLRTNTSFILQPPTNSTASLGIKVTGGEYRVDDMFDGSKIQSNAIMPENESLANSIVDDDDNTLVVLAAKYDHNFEKNVPTRGDDREIVLKNAPVPFKIINPAIADNIKQEFIKVLQCIVHLANIRSDLLALTNSKQGT